MCSHWDEAVSAQLDTSDLYSSSPSLTYARQRFPYGIKKKKEMEKLSGYTKLGPIASCSVFHQKGPEHNGFLACIAAAFSEPVLQNPSDVLADGKAISSPGIAPVCWLAC